VSNIKSRDSLSAGFDVITCLAVGTARLFIGSGELVSHPNVLPAEIGQNESQSLWVIGRWIPAEARTLEAAGKRLDSQRRVPQKREELLNDGRPL
jgi:hypothetical protein